MSEAAPLSFSWDHLTDLRAAILEAYFALYQHRDPATIGSGEIAHWFRERGRNAPSEALIRTILAQLQLPRRTVGRPAHTTDPVPSPPLSVRRIPTPRPRRTLPR